MIDTKLNNWWIKSPSSFIKFNFDAIYLDDSNIVVSISRDHFGNSIGIWYKHLITTSVEVAKFTTLSLTITSTSYWLIGSLEKAIW